MRYFINDVVLFVRPTEVEAEDPHADHAEDEWLAFQFATNGFMV
jgi:hypothetical protein